MNITYLLPFLLLILSSQSQMPKLDYPITEKKKVTDTYFGVEVVDNYRWLEDDRSKETAQWVEQQNKLTFGSSIKFLSENN